MSLCVIVTDLPEDISEIDLFKFESKVLDAVQFAAFGVFKNCPNVNILQEVYHK